MRKRVSTRKLANKEETDQILADIKDQPFTVHEVKKGTQKQPSALQQVHCNKAGRRISFHRAKP